MKTMLFLPSFYSSTPFYKTQIVNFTIGRVTVRQMIDRQNEGTRKGRENECALFPFKGCTCWSS